MKNKGLFSHKSKNSNKLFSLVDLIILPNRITAMVRNEVRTQQRSYAIVKATCYGFIPIPVFALLLQIEKLEFPDYFEVTGGAVSLLLSLSIYLIITFAGWLLVGFPLHHIFVRYVDASWYAYIGSLVALSVLLFLWGGQMPFYIFLVFAGIQVITFRLNVFKNDKPKPKGVTIN